MHLQYAMLLTIRIINLYNQLEDLPRGWRSMGDVPINLNCGHFVSTSIYFEKYNVADIYFAHFNCIWVPAQRLKGFKFLSYPGRWSLNFLNDSLFLISLCVKHIVNSRTRSCKGVVLILAQCEYVMISYRLQRWLCYKPKSFHDHDWAI